MSWRKFVFNVTGLKYRRQNLRSKSTLAETVLWRKLKNRQLGCKFVRQYSVEGYVMDFYCPEKKLGIELEGSIHKLSEVSKYDQYRKKYLQAYNIKILKFENSQVLANLDKVIAEIAISLP